jgi:hypothetical protein
MKKSNLKFKKAGVISVLVLGGVVLQIFSNPAIAADEKLINEYLAKAEGVSLSDAEALWNKEWQVKGEMRSCTTCHGSDIRKPGKHKRSGKKIEPMAITVNAERFTSKKKIEKWFKRNCKWTMGRVCTDAEKGSFLLYLTQKDI